MYCIYILQYVHVVRVTFHRQKHRSDECFQTIFSIDKSLKPISLSLFNYSYTVLLMFRTNLSEMNHTCDTIVVIATIHTRTVFLSFIHSDFQKNFLEKHHTIYNIENVLQKPDQRNQKKNHIQLRTFVNTLNIPILLMWRHTPLSFLFLFLIRFHFSATTNRGNQS